jgi:hypothetical protein
MVILEMFLIPSIAVLFLFVYFISALNVVPEYERGGRWNISKRSVFAITSSASKTRLAELLNEGILSEQSHSEAGRLLDQELTESSQSPAGS